MSLNGISGNNNNDAQIKQLLTKLLQGAGNQGTGGGPSPLAGLALNGQAQKPCGCPGGCNCCG